MMIGLGAPRWSREFSWVLYVFGAFLVFTGIKMWMVADHMPDIAQEPGAASFLRKHLRVTPQLEGNAFFVQRARPGHVARWCAGPRRCSWRCAWWS